MSDPQKSGVPPLALALGALVVVGVLAAWLGGGGEKEIVKGAPSSSSTRPAPEKKRAAKFAKGSAEAKAHMAAIRNRRKVAE